MALLDVRNLSKYFPIHGGILKREVGRVYAVDNVSFQLNEGETLGVVGESGCGKSTLARSIIRLYEPSAGTVTFDGQDFTALEANDLKNARRSMQMIFQDPYASLNPRMSVGKILEEPFLLHGIGNQIERRRKIEELLNLVGLRPDAVHRYPHEFSGGQRQRIGIARALALDPKLVICDEAVSALDVSIQAQVLNLLVELQERLGLTYLFISHDLSVIKFISDRVAVMYLGRIVELASSDTLFEGPKHPYTQALLASLPVPDPSHTPSEEMLEGDVPSPSSPPSGCYFHTRCRYVTDECKTTPPRLIPMPDDPRHQVACHLTDPNSQSYRSGGKNAL
ncbi:MAG: dipeptide ABC transporter ATP-binding protein [Myxococcota bacterium]|nr:dipeptide ABC transporter ATP-binding protein [Myxococcota bacterium]